MKYLVVIHRIKTGNVETIEFWVHNTETKEKHSSWSNLSDARRACADLNRWTA